MVSWDKSLKEQQQYLEKTQMDVPAIRFDDPLVEQFNRQYRIDGVPTLLIFDTAGRLITRQGRECLSLPIRPEVLKQLGDGDDCVTWRALIAPTQATLLAAREEELKAMAPVFKKYADFPRIEEIRNWQGYFGASSSVEKLMAEVGREIGGDWKDKKHHLDQLITLALEMKPQPQGYRGLLEVYSGACFAELGSLSADKPEIIPALWRFVDGAGQTGDANRNCRNWGVHGIVTAAIAGNQDAYDKLADWKTSINIDHAPLTIFPVLRSACAEGNPRALQLAHKIFAQDHYYVHVAFGVFVPAALQGDKKALDAMAEIATADDVRDYAVYAKQVLEESAKRGHDYARELLKANEGSTDDSEDMKAGDSESKAPTTRGQPGDTPQIDCTTLDGKRVTSAELRGKVVVVQFWSTACASCLAAMPDVKQTYEKYSAKGVFFLGVSDDRDLTVLEKHLEDHGITWPQTLDSAALCKAFGVHRFPAAFILGKSGRIEWAVHPTSLDVTLPKVLNEKP
jgi:thiol-disulfide isomerase/thioredoxin